MAKEKLVTVSKDACCCPKKEGSLGIRNLQIFNEAFLSKLATSIYSATDMVLHFFRSRFLTKVNMSRIVVSFIWGSLRQIYMAYYLSAFRLVNSDRSASTTTP